MIESTPVKYESLSLEEICKRYNIKGGILVPHKVKLYTRRMSDYELMKFWRNPQGKSKKLRSIIRKAKHHERTSNSKSRAMG